ncbi:Crp/Fnr family transcriptional regulator [Fulvivirga sedimenti]|uniref:Crp/Fnr family transcriptional regulator n=1 Tax=Fulvivirga sedimenti TaxID=2879465 RepID=A0A9X1L1B3_9BACT|nr:Crp/Fnr family transcriptional regulator [Fulvivirga sedimenti]MCA6078047.1 Crp/Fnr family transcriptional regulator [Fulvivirga sedimenti]
MENNELWFFEDVNLFNIMCPHKTAGMADKHEFTRYRKNQFIYFPNDQARHIYMIAEGRVRIGSYLDDGKEIVKAILTTGEIFGELVLAGEDKRNDFAQAMDDNTTICPISIDEMKELMAENKELSFKIYKLIGLRIRKLEKKVESLVFKDARTRIIEFLREAAAWKGKKVGFETMIPTKLTHKDIANLTGTSRQTVTTILNELKDKNLIYFDRRKILIRDLDKLA